MKKINRLAALVSAAAVGGVAMSSATANTVQVDINLDMKHEVRGESNFDREKHITVHANLSEPDWNGEASAMNYLLNDLDVYLGRDNGQASWITRSVPQDLENPNQMDMAEAEPFGTWYKEELYDNLDADKRSYESRIGEMIMGGNPHAVMPSYCFYETECLFGDDANGKFILQDHAVAAEWIGRYLDNFFRKPGETSGPILPKYWEVVNEPDMEMNNEGHFPFMVNSWENLFEYHSLVAKEIRNRLGEDAPLVGGMTWGLHDLGGGDFWRRATDPDWFHRYVGTSEGDEAYKAMVHSWIDSSKYWSWNSDIWGDFALWDIVWKGFMDAAGADMDFYSIHLYDWVAAGTEDPFTSPTNAPIAYRYGGPTEAVFEMVEWYQQHKFGEPKPWVVSEYGAIVSNERFGMDYTFGDWKHVETFNRMFLQILKRPDMVEKSMPFAPVKATWGYTADADGNPLRYEPSLMQTDDVDYMSSEAEWYFSDKIQWYELWSDVKGTRIDTASTDPDIQVDAYVDGNHAYLILNNMEWETSTVDLNTFGLNGNSIKGVSMKHSYLGRGLSATEPGRGVMAEAQLASLPETLTIPAGSTIIIDVEYNNPVVINQLNNERKYYGESLSGAGTEDGAVHRTGQMSGPITAHVNGVDIPEEGEAVVRVTGRFVGTAMVIHGHFHEFTINGHEILPEVEVREIDGEEKSVFDFIGMDYANTHHSYLRTFDIPVPIEYLKTNNEITVGVQQGGIYANVNIVVWEASRDLARTSEAKCDPCVDVNSVSLPSTGVTVGEQYSIALNPVVLPENASDKTMTWTSSDLTVAAVDPHGIVTGVGAGTATITGQTNNGGKTVEARVSVTKVAPRAVRLIPGSSEMFVRGSLQLSADVQPFKASNKAVTWASLNHAVATVDAAGLVTAHAPGQVTITATTAEGNKVGNATIDVVTVAVEDMVIAPEFAIVPMTENFQLDAIISPSNASNIKVDWSSNNQTVATVDESGLVSALAVGRAIITGISDDGGYIGDAEIQVVSVDSDPFYVEAESFVATGGETDGFLIDAEKGLINYNQTGDWADYNVDFATPGYYQFSLFAGTPNDATGVEVFVGDTSMGARGLPNTGDYDGMQEVVVSNALYVASAGTHAVRILSVGSAGAWQWNADKIGFRLLLESDGSAPSPSPSPSTPASPLPSPSVSPSPSPSPSVSPSPSPSPSASPLPSPSPSQSPIGGGDVVVVELENFIGTDRNGAAVGGDTVNGFNSNGSSINWNTSGDYADYSVSFTQSGTYNIILDVASPMTGELGVAVSLNGAQIAASSLSATGDWEDYEAQTVATNVSVEAGTYTLRVQSQGASAWQWNADKLRFNLVEASGGPSPSPSASPSASPSPSPEPSDQPSSNPGQPIVVEGENFVQTGGAQGGFTTRTFWGTTTFADHILTGGWADYTVSFAADGVYDLSFIASTNEGSDSSAKIYIDGVSVAEAAITGENLNVFTEHAVASGLAISAGEHTIRVEAIGSTLKWHWFFDKMTFTAQ
ncbi:Ig-like domain-containing protein [Agaribacterium sp. ZY112]|uniref:Ig-like domain-containing protein n=1 Tax=Agaribacterium sp. ZY112 TaxID=3233574 RepID=UPI0035254EFB